MKLISSRGGHMRWTSTVTWGSLGSFGGRAAPLQMGWPWRPVVPLGPMSRWMSDVLSMHVYSPSLQNFARVSPQG